MADDFGSMKSRISDELIRPDLTPQIALEIQSAIKHYERDRYWFNEAQETAVMVAGQANLGDPADMLIVDTMTITYQGRIFDLRQQTWDWYRAVAGDDPGLSPGLPSDFAYYASQFWWFPRPDSAYPIKWSGVKRLPALVNDADSNEWMVSGEELIRTRARQAVKINYLPNDAAAAQMAAQMAAQGQPYLSPFEKIAHDSLGHASMQRISAKRLRTDVPISRRFLRGYV